LPVAVNRTRMGVRSGQWQEEILFEARTVGDKEYSKNGEQGREQLGWIRSRLVTVNLFLGQCVPDNCAVET
jgi:hypothetical protein